MKRYSLANYILSIESNDATIRSLFGTISIGGEGSYMGSVKVEVPQDLWSTEGYATGAWVHNKNLDRSGTVAVELSQLSDAVQKFIRLCNLYYSGGYGSLSMVLTNTAGTKIATCTDCLPKNIPGQEFGDTAAKQTWTFTCGKIVYN